MFLTRNNVTYIGFHTQGEAALVSREYLPVAVAKYCQRVGTETKEVYFTEAGKPYFPGFHGHFLSVTHTGSFLLFAFAPFPIGVDAEREGEVRPRIATRYFTPFEQTLPFAQVWTGREAVAKLTGVGLSHALKVYLTPAGATLDGAEYHLDSFLLEGFRITCAFS